MDMPRLYQTPGLSNKILDSEHHPVAANAYPETRMDEENGMAHGLACVSIETIFLESEEGAYFLLKLPVRNFDRWISCAKALTARLQARTGKTIFLESAEGAASSQMT